MLSKKHYQACLKTTKVHKIRVKNTKQFHNSSSINWIKEEQVEHWVICTCNEGSYEQEGTQEEISSQRIERIHDFPLTDRKYDPKYLQ